MALVRKTVTNKSEQTMEKKCVMWKEAIKILSIQVIFSDHMMQFPFLKSAANMRVWLNECEQSKVFLVSTWASSFTNQPLTITMHHISAMRTNSISLAFYVCICVRFNVYAPWFVPYSHVNVQQLLFSLLCFSFLLHYLTIV